MVKYFCEKTTCDPTVDNNYFLNAHQIFQNSKKFDQKLNMGLEMKNKAMKKYDMYMELLVVNQII